MATIKDVARLAGVSTTTVSHVINKTRFVAENTTKKVSSAIDELNYSPSFVARSLKYNSTRTIGMLVTKSTSPFFAEVIQGVEKYCYRQGYSMILCNTEGDLVKQKEYLRNLSEKRVDGILVMCSDLNQDLLALLEKKKDLPTVIMDWSQENIHTDKIEDNAELGGYLATKHLIDNGHTKIGCISGSFNKVTCQQRLQGFRRALQEANIAENSDWILEADFECASAVAATKQLLKSTEMPTALFCFNDSMALAAIATLHQKGVRVPQDMSIIGYDNIDMAAFFSPPLTSIHQPKYQLGEKATQLLLDKINNNELEQQVIELTPELVVRKSVMCL